MATDSSLHYTSVNHAYHLVGAINRLRQHSELCDITLNCGDIKIPAHKLILSVSSPYFKNILNVRPYISANVSEIQLKGIDGDGVQQIIEFFYTSAISVTEESVWKLLPAASLLRSDEITSLCCDFLSSQLQVENCLQVHKISTKCLCSGLLAEATKFIKDNFEKVLEEEVFLEMTIHSLIAHLKRMNDVVLDEDQMLQAIKCWIIHSIDDRQIHGLKIMEEFPHLEKKLQDFIPVDILREARKKQDLLTDAEGSSKLATSELQSHKDIDCDLNTTEIAKMTEILNSPEKDRQLVTIGVDINMAAGIKSKMLDPSMLTFQTTDYSRKHSDMASCSDGSFANEESQGSININSMPASQNSYIEDSDYSYSQDDQGDGCTWVPIDKDGNFDVTEEKSSPFPKSRTTTTKATHSQHSQQNLTTKLQNSDKQDTSRNIDQDVAGGSSQCPNEIQSCDWPGCTKQFTSKTGLRFHMNKHLDRYPYNCQLCGKGFNRLIEFVDHKNSHSGKVWKCSICGATPKTHHGRKVHEAQHKKKILACDQCDKTFTCQEYLTSHKKAHSKQFKCQVCFKEFGRKHHYKEHIKVHEQNGFHCTQCSFVTNYRQSLSRHMKVSHSAQKNLDHSCKFCMKVFNRMDTLRKHESVCVGDVQGSAVITAAQNAALAQSNPFQASSEFPTFTSSSFQMNYE